MARIAVTLLHHLVITLGLDHLALQEEARVALLVNLMRKAVALLDPQVAHVAVEIIALVVALVALPIKGEGADNEKSFIFNNSKLCLNVRNWNWRWSSALEN